MPYFFPTLYLEGFEGARRYCMARVPRPPKAILSAGGWHFNEALKFAAAECSERGTELWGLQHGGVYGLWEHADAEGIERGITDRFYCWGWSAGTGDPKVRNLPHPMFSRAAADPGEDVVIVSTALDFYPTRMLRTQTNAQAFAYIEGQARLWKAVSGALPGRAFYRMYPGDLGWRHKERVEDLCPGIRFDDSSAPYSERARRARLLIFDNPMTTFLEALGADLPCLLTWDPRIWRFRAEALPYIDSLREAGILFDDPEAAARQAGAIYADPRAWWDEPARRAAHRAFANRFALARTDWLAVWLKELGTK
jgi:putative transferase (TIGR04331 family)